MKYVRLIQLEKYAAEKEKYINSYKLDINSNKRWLVIENFIYFMQNI